MAPPDCIDAPYNFVPLADWVHIPDWAERVSHDLPFRDGLSGHLDLSIKARTPVLVGCEQQPANANAPGEVKPYQLPDGRYALPGSALKGMIRNVVEIASFSRMSFVDERRLGVRDLTSGARSFYGNRMTETMGRKTYKPRAKSGWLIFDSEAGCWSIEPCEYARVERRDLEKYHGSPWVKISNRDRPTARQKYDAWKQPRKIAFTLGPVQEHLHSGDNRLVYRKATDLGRGATDGVLVFTGQPSPKKHLEFVFFGNNDLSIRIPDPVFRGFLDIYDPDTEDGQETDWDYWKDKSRIPVFYLEQENRRDSVASLGLAQMYKLPYRHTVHDAIRHSSPLHLDEKGDDLATLIFGRVGEKATACLKGRVTFHHAIAQGSRKPEPQPSTILNGPKLTYYPNYVQQPRAKKNKIPNGQSYSTFMDDDCKIRGWKRYPARPKDQSQVQQLTVEQRENTAVQAVLCPLPSDTEFDSRMTFHNLKPEELGALCWALTWGGATDKHHSLGMGKPFGFGQITCSVTAADIRPNSEADGEVLWQDCRDHFIRYMDGAYTVGTAQGTNWRESEQITTLLGMADPAAQPTQGKLRHMRLTTEKDNEFKDAKTNLLVLPGYDRVEHPPTWAEQKAKRKAEIKRQAEAQAEQARQDEERQRKEAEQEVYDALPDEIKRIKDAERYLNEYLALGEQQQRSDRSAFIGRLNDLAEQAIAWQDDSQRNAAAESLERSYDSIGWWDPSKKKKQQREKQKAKREKQIADLRAGVNPT